MEPQQIEILLQRYFAGHTTLEEEKALRTYFRQHEPPEPLAAYKPYFRLLEEAREESLDGPFLADLEQALARRRPARRLRASLARPWARAAAIALLAFLAWWLVPTRSSGPPPPVDWARYEPQSTEEAVRITLQALQVTSEALHQGAGASEKLKNLKALNHVIQ